MEGPAPPSARGERATLVRTDAAGLATAELLPRSTEPGITTIGIQVIRPSSDRNDVAEMVVGQGITSVSWSAPGLSVRAVGPSLVASDGAVSYRVEVTNSGDLPTRGVTLSYTPPTGVSVLNSTPAGQQFGQRYEWRLGDLPARTTTAIELNGARRLPLRSAARSPPAAPTAWPRKGAPRLKSSPTISRRK
jgi:uncharacterized repeat protein (TIGR01451 family)